MHITATRARKILTVALAAGTIAVLSACSSGSGSDSDSAGGTIKIGVITSVGSAISNYPDVQVGAQAAIKNINDAGGINGKKLTLDFCNTRGDTNQSATCARQLVTDKVVASVGQSNTFASSSMPITAAAKIPEIGNIPFGTQLDYTSPYSNPFSAGHPGNWAAGAFSAQQVGAKKFVTFAIDVPGGIQGAEIAEAAAKGLGLTVAKRIVIPASGVVDYSPYVQQAIDEGVDAAELIEGPVAVAAILKAEDALGANIHSFVSSYTLGQSEAAAIPTLAEKVVVASSLPSVNDTTNPGVKEYLKELDADGVPDTLELRRLAGFNAWLSVHAAAKIFAQIKGDVTSASVVKELKTTKPIDLYGLTTWDPASLKVDSSTDKFPRVPKVPVYFLTYKDGLMVDAGLKPITDAFQYSR